MSAAIPDDVMAAARAVCLAYLEEDGKLPDAMRGQIMAGTFDTWPLYAVAARAITAERLRCMQAVRDERIFDDGESLVGADSTDIAYDMALCHALDAITRGASA